MSLFSFFTTTSNTFEDKKPYENVLVLLHRHWFVIFIRIVAFVFVAAIPFVLYAFFSPYLTGQIANLYWFFTSIFFLFWWYGLFYAITMYLLDIWIVTDHRILDSEQHGFFNRTVAEIGLAKIQDISVSVTGLIPTFLDYGNLEVQSAGASEKFFFKEIPHPNAVRELIMEAHNEFIRIHPDDLEVHDTP